MPETHAPSTLDIEAMDRIYREGGLRRMASPHIHYQDPICPHAGCANKMEWIDFQLELHGDMEHIYNPLVRSWWEGKGFAGRCPNCGGWIRFTTLRMEAIRDEDAAQLARLPENWHMVAQFG